MEDLTVEDLTVEDLTTESTGLQTINTQTTLNTVSVRLHPVHLPAHLVLLLIEHPTVLPTILSRDDLKTTSTVLLKTDLLKTDLRTDRIIS